MPRLQPCVLSRFWHYHKAKATEIRNRLNIRANGHLGDPSKKYFLMDVGVGRNVQTGSRQLDPVD